MKQVIEAKLRTAHGDRFEVEPFGLTAGIDKSRPVMLFREKGGEAVLPVWLAAVDAGIALTQHNTQAFAMSPHDLTLQALSQLGVRAETCDFIEVKGHQQYVEIKFSGSRRLRTMRARADHAVSFCLQAKVKFYCTRKILEQCRDLEADFSKTNFKGRGEPPRNRQMYLN